MHERLVNKQLTMTVNFQNILPICVFFVISITEDELFFGAVFLMYITGQVEILRIFQPCIKYCLLQVLAEICDDGRRCSDGEKCCTNGCCYYDQDDKRYTYGYRLSVWNMWYFWFVVLFILMSCFGGCGYYKQRQRVMRSQTGMGGHNFLSVFQVVPRRPRHGNSRIVTLEPTGYPAATGYGYPHSPDIIGGVTMAPPPYSEVVSNPDQFPVNTKSGLPANTAEQYQPVQSGDPTSEPANQMPQPPPYSEIASQHPPITIPETNQNPASH